LENAIVEVFEELTKYDNENRFYPEGWKTNDSWKVNKKFNKSETAELLGISRVSIHNWVKEFDSARDKK